MRVKVTLACGECKQRNYNTVKNKKNNPDRVASTARSARSTHCTRKLSSVGSFISS